MNPNKNLVFCPKRSRDIFKKWLILKELILYNNHHMENSSSSLQTATTELVSSAVQQLSFEQLISAAEVQYQSLRLQLEDLKKTLTALRKANAKLSKKQSKEKKPKVETPRTVSAELAAFMKLSQPLSTRTQATKAISFYTKENKLQEGKNFKVDATLGKLLNLEVGVVKSYIAINGHLSHHFPKSV